MATIVRSLAISLVVCCSFSHDLFSQTILNPGDLAVLGVNANLSGCGEGNTDEISFVCFKDITTGTQLDLTDNGWERLNAGQWGNNEGFVSMERTGGTIPAGTVITIRLPSVGNSGYMAVAPDADWSFTAQSFATVNLNLNGDQVYFLQGGEWERGNDNPGSALHDAEYTGGIVLFGFNTKVEWVPQDSPQNSGLHPDVEPCYHMEPTGNSSDFISYNGPVTPAGQLEWIKRISDPANWEAYSDCQAYRRPPSALELQPGTIGLNCTFCTGCDTLQETMVFTLPDFGGPYTVIYSDGTQEFTADGITNGGTDQIEVTKTSTFEILSVTDAESCPVFSNFGPGVGIVVEATPPAATARLETCTEANGEGLFDLTSIENAVNLGTGEPVRWYADATQMQPIDDPALYRTAPGVIFAVVGPVGCSSAAVPVDLTLIDQPSVDALVDQEVKCKGASNGAVILNINGGNPPYSIDWSDDAFDNQSAPDNVPAGTYGITVTDNRGCTDSTQVTLAEPEMMVVQCSEQQPASSVGSLDGQAAVTVSGGVAPYQLEWSGTASGDQSLRTAGTTTIDNLGAGNYQVLVADANGCVVTCTFTITDPACSMTLTVEKQDISCAGLNDGTVNLGINNGTAPFSINWDVDRFDGSQNLTGLAQGAYSVIVTDDNGCSAAGSVTINAAFPALDIDISPGGPVCTGDCYGFVFSLEGTGPFTIFYEVSSGGTASQETFVTDNLTDFLELCPADVGITDGRIDVVFQRVEDANCQKVIDQTESIILLEPSAFSIDSTLCFGDSLVINGKTYDANNPSGTEVLSGGSVNGCDSVVTIRLNFAAPSELLIDSMLCEGESLMVNGVLYDEGNPSGVEVLKSGSITGCDSVIVVDLQFQRDTSVVLTRVLCGGEHLVVNGTRYDEGNPSGTEVLQRQSGCDSTVLVNLSFVPAVTARLEGGGTLCPGDSTELTFRLEGAPSASMQLSDGVSPPVLLQNISDGHTLTVSPLITTTYRIDFVQVNGGSCPAGIEGSVTIDVNELTVSIGQENDFDGYGVSCAGEADGALVLDLTAGAEPVSVLWNTGATSVRIDNLSAGYYSVTVNDAGNCEATDSIVLSEPDPILLQSRSIEPSCPEDKDGVIILDAIDGGAPPYNLSINGDGVRLIDEVPLFIRDLNAGTYRIQLTDENGCIVTDTLDLMSDSTLFLELGGDIQISRWDSVVLSPAINFNAESLIWLPDLGLNASNILNPTARPQRTVTYTLKATDAKGCSVSDQITVVVEDRSRLYAPSAFSPNDDGVNDYFNLFSRSDDVDSYILRIFDRWGGLLFEGDEMRPNALQEGWDGRVRGQRVSPGVYVFFAEVKYIDGTEEIVSGELNLLR